MIRKFKMRLKRRFKRKQNYAIVPTPPMHPNCRHTVVPFVKKDK